jgi:DNA-directed RNA polymerase beta subunit
MLSVADSTRTAGAVARTRYARIPEVLPIPNLIELQLDSFKWFIEKGLRELFDEISPIKDFTGKVMELQFLDYEFGDPKYSEEECRTKDLTFSRPLYVQVELTIKETGEIQRQRVYMGDYPWMTDQGTFVINGAERVVVSQLVRSPGVYYSELEDPRRAGCCSAPRSSRTAARGSSSRRTTRTSSGSRSTASARSRRRPCSARSATRRTTRSRRCSPPSTSTRTTSTSPRPSTRT